MILYLNFFHIFENVNQFKKKKKNMVMKRKNKNKIEKNRWKKNKKTSETFPKPYWKFQMVPKTDRGKPLAQHSVCRVSPFIDATERSPWYLSQRAIHIICVDRLDMYSSGLGTQISWPSSEAYKHFSICAGLKNHNLCTCFSMKNLLLEAVVWREALALVEDLSLCRLRIASNYQLVVNDINRGTGGIYASVTEEIKPEDASWTKLLLSMKEGNRMKKLTT